MESKGKTVKAREKREYSLLLLSCTMYIYVVCSRYTVVSGDGGKKRENVRW